MKCSQCEKPAMFATPTGYPDKQVALCLDCYHKFVQVVATQQESLGRQLNYLAALADFQIGLPLNIPRFPESKTINLGEVILNNIKIDNSNVGVVNTGSLEMIDSSITILNESNEKEAAKSLKDITEAISNSADLSEAQKKSAIDILSFVSSETAKPKAQRRSAGLLLMIAQVASILSGSNALTELWRKVKPIIEGLFN